MTGIFRGGAIVLLGLLWCGPAQAQSVIAAVLPASRSVQVGAAATAFASVVNVGVVTATSCTIAPLTVVPATFSFQATNPTTNQPTGTANAAVNIAAGATQTFLFSFVPTAAFGPTDVQLAFSCSNATAAPITIGLDTIQVSASATAVPDIIALAATTTGDGTLHMTDTVGVGAFSVAVSNVGASGSLTASADTGSTSLPLQLNVCQTNPSTGSCSSAIAATIPAQINAGATATFAILASSTGAITFSPGQSRIFVRFLDAAGTTRGSTSVAVTTPTILNILGTFTGTGTTTQSGCLSSLNNGTFFSTASLTVTNQTGSAFNGFGSVTFQNGSSDTFSVAGTVNSSGQISGSGTNSIFASGGFFAGTGSFTASGSTDGTHLTFSVSGKTLTGETCTVSAVYQLSR